LFCCDHFGGRDAAGEHRRLVLRDELRRALHGGVGLRLRVGDLVGDLLAEHALLAAQDFAHDAGAGVELFDRELVAFLQILAVGRIRPGLIAQQADEQRVVGGERETREGESGGGQRPRGTEGRGQERTARISHERNS
jgi:hypothetical protein